MRYGNPLSNGTEAQARKLYESIGLCYEHGQPFDRCGCPSPEDQEQWKALDIVVGYVPPEPETVGEAVNVAYGTWEFPWTDEECRSELDNHRPEVGF